MEAKDYLLVAVSVVAALLLFFRMSKENKVFVGAGILCLCYGGYHVAQAFLDENAVDILGWILRGIAVIMLIWMFTVFSSERAKSKAAQTESDASAKDDPCNAEDVAEETDEEESETE